MVSYAQNCSGLGLLTHFSVRLLLFSFLARTDFGQPGETNVPREKHELKA